MAFGGISMEARWGGRGEKCCLRSKDRCCQSGRWDSSPQSICWVIWQWLVLPPATISSQSVSYLPTQPELAGAMTSQTKSHVERWAALGATTPQVSFAVCNCTTSSSRRRDAQQHLDTEGLNWLMPYRHSYVGMVSEAAKELIQLGWLLRWCCPTQCWVFCNQNTQKLRIPNKSKCVTSIYVLAVHQAAAHQTSRTASSAPGGGRARGCGSSSAPPPSPSSCPASAAQTQAALPRRTRPALCKPSSLAPTLGSFPFCLT